MERVWERIILGESHLAKRRDGSIMNFLKNESYGAIHNVTGTPIINSAIDLYTPLQSFWLSYNIK